MTPRILPCLMLLLSVFSLNVAAWEEPKYQVISSTEQIEVRQYAPYLVAQMQVTSDFDSAGSVAHDVLLDYISGNNTQQQSISMAVPVNQQSAAQGESMAMAVPVLQGQGRNEESTYKVSFVIPSKYTADTVPMPLDSRVSIHEMPANTVAVRQYSGFWSEENYRENEQILLTAVAEQQWQAVGTPRYARYNPPWWPWFMRRNEVMVDVVRADTEPAP